MRHKLRKPAEPAGQDASGQAPNSEQTTDTEQPEVEDGGQVDVVAEKPENVVVPDKNVVVNGKTTTKPKKTTTKEDFKTTTRREYNWRIEINRRKRKGEGYTYHWNYRLTRPDGKRRSKYGGNLTFLMARDPDRWQRYLYNSRHNKRTRANGKED